MSRIFDEMCSKPEIFLAFLSKSNYSTIIVSKKQFAIFETISGYWETKTNIKIPALENLELFHTM